MYTRTLKIPTLSFFLFGPRGTGKTTWLKQVLPDAKKYDLLKNSTFLPLLKNPGLLSQETLARPQSEWTIIDEIQKLSALLDEVHSILNESDNQYRFALTGSSARKIKRADANLLAGRAINLQFFPLTWTEILSSEKNTDIDDLLAFGGLPGVRIRSTHRDRVHILEAYEANYIKEEIQQEALVKNLDAFSRFLQIAAICNGQVTNVSSISRDCGIARQTVEGYFNVLTETFIGSWLQAWRPKIKVKEVEHPKFYLFDPGVARVLSGKIRVPMTESERGFLLETWIFHELRAAIHYQDLGGELKYWGTPSNSEVDFIWCLAGKAQVGIEIKSTDRWKSEYSKPLKELLKLGVIHQGIAVYTGKTKLRDGTIDVLPVEDFLEQLSNGQILKGAGA